MFMFVRIDLVPYEPNSLSNRSNSHFADKISYIYRHFNLDFNSLLEHINQSSKTRLSFNFRKFNFDVVSKILYH